MSIQRSVAGYNRTYALYTPAGYDPTKRYPLMLVYHGNGGTGAGIETTSAFDAVADANGFIVAYPDSAPGTNSWALSGDNNDLEMAPVFVTDLMANYLIDSDHVFVAGFSEGAALALYLACLYAGELFKGVGIVSCNATPALVKDCPAFPAQIPVVYFHGTADPASNYAGGNFQGKPTLSSAQTAAYLAQANGCSAAPRSVPLADKLSDGSQVRDILEKWSGGGGVAFYTITGGGHTWPGGVNTTPALGLASSLPASEIIWQGMSG